MHNPYKGDKASPLVRIPRQVSRGSHRKPYKRRPVPSSTLPLGEICTRIIVWLLLGTTINLFPVLFGYLLGAGDQPRVASDAFTAVLSSGDLLVAAGAILPPTLADLAINGKKARRSRILVVIAGAMLSLASLIFYGLAFANYLSRESKRPLVVPHLSADAVALLSVGFFLGATLLGALCVALLAADSDEIIYRTG